MNKNLRKAELVGEAFILGFKSGLMNESNVSLAGIVGLYQGLKYNGNLKRGIESGFTTLLVFSTVDGFSTIIKNWDLIGEKAEKEEE